MRIYGNRSIKTLAGQATRPTPSRVREALFNIWQGRVQGCRWLDLCAGSGAMGAEALCRGAAEVVGIEKSPKACAIIRQNWNAVASSEQSMRLIRGDVVQQILTLQGQAFDLMYFDPPYASDLYLPVLKAIATYHLLDEDGEIAVEHDATQNLPDTITPAPFPMKASAFPTDDGSDDGCAAPAMKLVCCRQKKYGSTFLTFYTPCFR